MYQVKKITTPQEQEKAFAIRKQVFVEEQHVPQEDEYDEFEKESTHFIAFDEQGNPCGTARWRKTEKGVKLERFAVLKDYRGKGVGALILQSVLADVDTNEQAKEAVTYMHAQASAVDFYKKYGFEVKGNLFYECDIAHYTMTR